MMKKEKFYQYIIFCLIGLNVIILAFFLLTKSSIKHQPPSNNFRAEVIKTFDFDSRQASVFKGLAKEHKQKMNEINFKQSKLLAAYFKTLTSISDSIDKEEILNEIELLEREKIEFTYNHFEEIKKIITRKQLPEFERFMRRVTDKLLSGQKNNPPPPKDIDL